MTPETILFLTSSSLLILLFQTCDAKYSYCSPSACGVIRNISYPYSLNDDPNHCGDRRYELACENNVTFLYLNTHKFYVKQINYHNHTIRLAHASIKNDTVCSFPTFSAYPYNFTIPFNRGYYGSPYVERLYPINFLSCSNPLKNSSLFTDIATHCASRYDYVKVGHMNASEVPPMCGIDLIAMTSWEFEDLNNVSLSEIHHSLLYGFELSFCSVCGESPYPTLCKK